MPQEEVMVAAQDMASSNVLNAQVTNNSSKINEFLFQIGGSSHGSIGGSYGGSIGGSYGGSIGGSYGGSIGGSYGGSGYRSGKLRRS